MGGAVEVVFRASQLSRELLHRGGVVGHVPGRGLGSGGGELDRFAVFAGHQGLVLDYRRLRPADAFKRTG